jgi:hypothetical protein
MTLVVGVDPHKQTHTVVAVRSGTGELVDELSATARASGYAQLLAWALAIDGARVWALEDVRGVRSGLEPVRRRHKWRARQRIGWPDESDSGHRRVLNDVGHLVGWLHATAF